MSDCGYMLPLAQVRLSCIPRVHLQSPVVGMCSWHTCKATDLLLWLTFSQIYKLGENRPSQFWNDVRAQIQVMFAWVKQQELCCADTSVVTLLMLLCVMHGFSAVSKAPRQIYILRWCGKGVSVLSGRCYTEFLENILWNLCSFYGYIFFPPRSLFLIFKRKVSRSWMLILSSLFKKFVLCCLNNFFFSPHKIEAYFHTLIWSILFSSPHDVMLSCSKPRQKLACASTPAEQSDIVAEWSKGQSHFSSGQPEHWHKVDSEGPCKS